MSLENYQAVLDKTSNQLRVNFVNRGLSIKKNGGFSKDLIEFIVINNMNLVSELKKLKTPESKEISKLLIEIQEQINDIKNNSVVDDLPTFVNPTIGQLVLESAYTELIAWRSNSTEKKLQMVFNYLSEVDHSKYNHWCAAFISWCLAQTPQTTYQNKHISIQKSAGALALKDSFLRDNTTKNFFINKDEFLIDSVVNAGDIVFWWRGKNNNTSGHVGVVFAVNDRKVKTIEGNVNSSLRVCEYQNDNNNPFHKGPGHGFVGLLRLP